MKNRLIRLMEKSLLAYSDTHIQEYLDTVKCSGLCEHGFPRLTACIGILIAHGRRTDLLPTFLSMMDLCCESIPRVKAANDFSVREICACIMELEASGVLPVSVISRWKDSLRSIDPTTCYTMFAKYPDDRVKNWALFTAVSEYYRMEMGLGGSIDFVDTQLASQLKWLDENGMYMDGEGDVHHPVVYDLVARGLFALLLSSGTVIDGTWHFSTDPCAEIEVIDTATDGSHAYASFRVLFNTGATVSTEYSVSSDGVDIIVTGEGRVGYLLPAFAFDGKVHTSITRLDGSLAISYGEWVCRYSTDGVIREFGRITANRNGHYKAYFADGERRLKIKILIEKEEK